MGSLFHVSGPGLQNASVVRTKHWKCEKGKIALTEESMNSSRINVNGDKPLFLIVDMEITLGERNCLKRK